MKKLAAVAGILEAVLFLTLVLSLESGQARAGDQVATVTQVEGEVKLFTNPGKKAAGPGPHALFEGDFYTVRDAQEGDKMEKGNILRAAPGAKARVVYPNGDQFYVGSGTAYRVTWDKDTATGTPRVDLAYGKLRGIVAKGGPRSRLILKTKVATMGVRGTDFFIASGGDEGGTQVTVLRGQVEVKPTQPHSKAVEVKTAYSVDVPPSAAAKTTELKTEKTTETKSVAKAESAAPVLRKTTREDLAGIQQASTIKTDVKEELKPLEKAAAQAELKDIKAVQPEVYAQIQADEAEGKATAADMSAKVIETMEKVAPAAPKQRKPYKSELENLEDGAYDKYFKIVD